MCLVVPDAAASWTLALVAFRGFGNAYLMFMQLARRFGPF
jgi:hypothetical protein